MTIKAVLFAAILLLSRQYITLVNDMPNRMNVFIGRKVFSFVVAFFIVLTSFGQEIKPYTTQLNEVEKQLKSGDFQSAVQLLNTIVEQYPNADEAYYARALIYGQVRNLELAIINAEQAFTISPSLQYYSYLLDLYGATKDVGKGLKLIQNAKVLFPKETSIGRDLITTLGHLDSLDQAYAVYEQEKRLGFHSDTLDVVMADVYLAKNELNTVIELLTPWEGKSSLGSLYGKLAYAQLQQKKIKNAISTLHLGLEVSKDPLLYFDLANAYVIAKKQKLAYESLKKGFESADIDFGTKYRIMLDLLGKNEVSFSSDQLLTLANALTLTHPRVAESHMLKGEVLWKRNKPEEAKSLFLTAVGLSPHQVDAWRMLINLDIATNDLNTAVVHAQEALKANPSNPALLYFSGISYFLKEDNAKARDLLEAALNNSTGENTYLQSMIYTSLGDLYNKLNLFAMSDVAYEEAIKLDSSNTNAMNNLAYYLSVRKKDLDKAANYSYRSIELEPDMPTYLDTYAWILFQQGNYKEALSWIEKAIKLSPKPSGVLLEHYGDILYKLDKSNEAVKQWTRALNADGHSEEEKTKLKEKILNKKYVE